MLTKQARIPGAIALILLGVGWLVGPVAVEAMNGTFDDIANSPDYNLIDDDTAGLIGSEDDPDLVGGFGLEYESGDYDLDHHDEVDLPDDLDHWDVSDTAWSSDEAGVYDSDYDWVTDDPGLDRWYGDADE